ncbi:MAG: hypothetical protein ACK44D_09800, partial [Bacteroidia bacterium]
FFGYFLFQDKKYRGFGVATPSSLFYIMILLFGINYFLKVKPGLGMEAVTPEGKPSGQACNAHSPTPSEAQRNLGGSPKILLF